MAKVMADSDVVASSGDTESMAVIARGAMARMARRSERGEEVMMVGDLSSVERRSV
jgi:hypothetical protein